jgi:hypothetical protein
LRLAVGVERWCLFVWTLLVVDGVGLRFCEEAWREKLIHARVYVWEPTVSDWGFQVLPRSLYVVRESDAIDVVFTPGFM